MKMGILGEVITGVFLSLMLMGCTKPSDGPTRSPEETDSHKHTELLRDRARFTDFDHSPKLDVQSYSLKGAFDWKSARLTADLEVRYAFSGAQGEKVVLNSRVARIVSVRSAETELAFELDHEKGLLSFPHLASQPSGTVVIRYEVQATSPLSRTDDFSLFAVTPRKGDPINSRVVATFSEPTSAQLWMPCHDVTTDRALFASEFILDNGEMLIANGDLTKDTRADGKRVMAYSTKYTLPTYLMAFALGEFAQSSRQMGDLPIQIWFRKGLTIDEKGMLDALEHQMQVFEKLLVPYPFEKYALVLLPEFGGGLEHAGISFQGEVSSTRGELSRDFGLSAHELAHQWFGDLVTVTTWDDLWIKEGMATLLAEEASRKFEDRAGSNRLFGSALSPASGDAVLDPTLSPDQKYTSGPYDRAAWVLTQVRSLVGEEQFWGTLRTVLNQFAFGTIGTEEFVEAFAPHLGSEATARFKKALSAKALPGLELSQEGDLSVTDSDSALVAPIGLSYAANGTLTPKSFSTTEKQNLKALTGGYWVLDLEDVHPIEGFYSPDSNAENEVLAFLQPPVDQLSHWATLPPNVQWRTLLLKKAWDFEKTDFTGFYTSLDSDTARYFAIRQYCRTLKNEKLGAAERVLTPILFDAPYFAIPPRGVSPALSDCPAELGKLLFTRELSRLAQGLPLPNGEADIALVGAFSIDTELALSVWSGLLSKGRSVRERLIAAAILARHLAGSGGYGVPSEETRGGWVKALASALEAQSATETAYPILEGLRAAKDKSALSSIAVFVNENTNSSTLASAVCAAYQISADDDSAWDGFKAKVTVETLPKSVQDLVRRPAGCDTLQRRPR